MRIRPRGEQPEGAGVASHSCEDAAGLLMLGLATILAVLFMTAMPAWTQEATSIPSPEGTPGLPEKTGGETAEVQRDRYDEELGEHTVAGVTPKGATPVLPKTGGADLLPLFLGASCLTVGVLALLLGRGGVRPGARPVDRPPEGR